MAWKGEARRLAICQMTSRRVVTRKDVRSREEWCWLRVPGGCAGRFAHLGAVSEQEVFIGWVDQT